MTKPTPLDRAHHTAHHPQLRRGAEHLHGLGPRALTEFLEAIGLAHGCFGDILDMLGEWRERITPELLVAVGADRFPPVVTEVPR